MTVPHVAAQTAKAIYLANRHPRLTRDEFRERWLRHYRVGEVVTDPRLQSSVAGVRYCLAVDPSDVLPSATNEHDGVALLSLRGAVAIPAFHAVLTENDIAYADELRTFERPVQDVTLYGASELVVDGAETSTVVLELTRRRSDIDPVSYLRQDDEARDRRLQSDVTTLGVRRWVRNIVIAPGPRGFGYDAVNELWFDSVDHVGNVSTALEEFLQAATHTERRATTVLVTTVVASIGRDRP